MKPSNMQVWMVEVANGTIVADKVSDLFSFAQDVNGRIRIQKHSYNLLSDNDMTLCIRMHNLGMRTKI